MRRSNVLIDAPALKRPKLRTMTGLTALCLSATSCATDRYAGVDLRPGATPAEMQALQPLTRKGGSGGGSGGGSDQVLPVDTAPVSKGLAKARIRLAGAAHGETQDAADIPDRPTAAVVAKAYLHWINWTCDKMIDACPDDALVHADDFHAEQIRCDVKSVRASCTFDIVRGVNRKRCVGAFKLGHNENEHFWTVEREQNRPWLKPIIECQ